MIIEQSDLLNAKRVHPNVVYNVLEVDSPKTLLLCDGLDEMCVNNDVSISFFSMLGDTLFICWIMLSADLKNWDL